MLLTDNQEKYFRLPRKLEYTISRSSPVILFIFTFFYIFSLCLIRRLHILSLYLPKLIRWLMLKILASDGFGLLPEY